MPAWWVALTVVLWLFVVVEGVLLMGVLRQLGVLHRRLDELSTPSDEPIGLAVGVTAPDFTLPQVGGGSACLSGALYTIPGGAGRAGVVRSLGVVNSRERIEQFLARA